DSARGDVLDQGSLELLRSGQVRIVSEELVVDEEARSRALVGSFEVPALIQEDHVAAYRWWASLPAPLQRPLQWRGSSATRSFGLAAVAIGRGGEGCAAGERPLRRADLAGRSPLCQRQKIR
ncbi:unnamed protein product, partial [Prorocentrum cordatum]